MKIFAGGAPSSGFRCYDANMTPPSVVHTTPLFHWLGHRAAGVLVHPTALPSGLGVGVFDEAVDQLLAFLVQARMKYWQVCPLGPTGYGDSPYQCFSSFAGNPYLIDLVALVRMGLLDEKSLDPLRALSATKVDFGALYTLKRPLLFLAHARWLEQSKNSLPFGNFTAFQKKQSAWLACYGLFSALKDHYEGRPWWEWPNEVRSFALATKSPLAKQLADKAEAYEFIQYLFFGQWSAVRNRASKLGISIIGDTPIFTALDSADVWGNPQLFQLDQATLRPTAVAGVPPDYFSADGQLWGNPLYDWPAHAAEKYAWWIARLLSNFELCDIVRIDHFRGFEAYWSVPADAVTAKTGAWMPGPGMDFFRAIARAIPDAKLIAEDLGLLTPATIELRAGTGLPGMAVLQFAFGGKADNFYLPHNHSTNSVVYPGTHDNDTTLGWYASADERTRDHVRRYLRISGQEIGWDLTRTAYRSVANLAIVSLQDLMSLGPEARFNTPGKAQGNWTWRYTPEQLRLLCDNSAGHLAELASLYGRDPTTTEKRNE